MAYHLGGPSGAGKAVSGTGSFTSLSSYLVIALEVLKASGYELGNLQRDTGVDLHALSESQQRIPIEDIGAAWRLAAAVTGDSAIGVRAAQQYFKPAHWQSLGLAILCSSTLRQALERVGKYFRVVSDAGSISVEEWDGNVVIVARMRAHPGELGYEALEFGLAALLRLFSDMFAGQLVPREVHLVRPDPAVETDFEQLFGCPVVFGAPFESMAFAMADADKALPGGCPQLAAYQDTFSEDYIRRFGQDSVSMMVKDEILRLLPGGEPSQTAIAKALHISSRNLQRRLKAENTCFRELLGEIRMKLARFYVAQSDNSYMEIAYLLGFSDQSNFARAFKQWFGLSPSRYRNQLLDKAG
ncbi:AraC family transcriptional regulator [Parahaliea mediterranea]|uniref:AraC family transcriptional regulator n=1 Tax=Parahaliea mediterranea TaxID=651086 RepID=A0A939IM11_9GAMM|nr:AraC family transcriptional regulator [Parahaliea mediterranea]MBN7796548.1 AraC family transcriptional regulator [Parahaliea mediterranea]